MLLLFQTNVPTLSILFCFLFVADISASQTTDETGTLNIRDVKSRQLKPDNSFDVLVRQMDRYYSYFVYKNIDWGQLTAKYRVRAEAAASPTEFEKAVLPMLAELKDGHVWIQRNGQTISHYKPPDWQPNFDFSIVAKDLRDVQTFDRLGLIAKTVDGAGWRPNLGTSQN